MAKKDDSIDVAALGDTFTVRVTPKASADRIKVEAGPDGVPVVRVYVTCVPEDGKANEAVIRLLSKYMGLPPSSLSILRGARGREKVISIHR